MKITTRRTWIAAAALAATAFIAACGGGGSDAGAPSAAGSAWTTGPITGLGSIIVNGVRYDDSNAKVEHDEDSAEHRSSDLKIGMVVEVQSSSVDESRQSASASTIRYGSEIVGAIESFDGTTLRVLGQAIDVTSTTVIDDSIGSLAGLRSGLIVEIHALYDASTQRYVATRIEDKPAGTVFRLRGSVAELDTAAKTFKLSTAVISYAGIDAAALPPNFANGQRVRVTLQPTQVDGRWVATAVRTGVRRVDDFGDARIRGTVTAFVSTADFEVNGIKVNASNARVDGNSQALALGRHVEVRGSTVNGVLVAARVRVDGSARDRDDDSRLVELHGTIASLNTETKSFVTRDVAVDYSAVVEWKDGSEASLANGRAVEVKGVWSADRRTLKASRVEFE